MKHVTTFILVLLVLVSVQGIDSNLQKEVQILKSQLTPSPEESSLFSSIFGKLNTGSKEATFSDNINSKRAIFKGLQSLNQLRQDVGINKVDNDLELPYQALLPRRRMPLDLKLQNAGKLFSSLDEKENLKPLGDLFFGLNQQSNRQNEESAKWENPLFSNKQNGDLLPFFNIFGKKRNKKTKFTQSLSESQIQTLLINKAPFLQGGRIIKMTSNNYKKGIFLNIQFLDKNSKMFTIIARYAPRKQRLEIVSMKQNSSAKQNQDYEVGLEGKSFSVKTQQTQDQIKEKDEQLKALSQKLEKLQEQNKILTQKALQKQNAQAPAKSNVEQKAETPKAQQKVVVSKIDEKVEVPTGEVSKVEKISEATVQKPKVQEKKIPAVQKKEQKKTQNLVKEVVGQKIKPEQKTEPANSLESKNIVNQ